MRKVVVLVGAVVFVDTTFYAAITPLLPRYAEDFDLTKASAGLLTAAYPIGTVLGSLPGGWLATRIGVRPTVLVGLAMLGASSIAFGFAPSIAALDAARLLQGVGGAFTWAGGLAWLIAATPRERARADDRPRDGDRDRRRLTGPVLGVVARRARAGARLLVGRGRRHRPGGARAAHAGPDRPRRPPACARCRARCGQAASAAASGS